MKKIILILLNLNFINTTEVKNSQVSAQISQDFFLAKKDSEEKYYSVIINLQKNLLQVKINALSKNGAIGKAAQEVSNFFKTNPNLDKLKLILIDKKYDSLDKKLKTAFEKLDSVNPESRLNEINKITAITKDSKRKKNEKIELVKNWQILLAETERLIAEEKQKLKVDLQSIEQLFAAKLTQKVTSKDYKSSLMTQTEADQQNF